MVVSADFINYANWERCITNNNFLKIKSNHFESKEKIFCLANEIFSFQVSTRDEQLVFRIYMSLLLITLCYVTYCVVTKEVTKI